MTLVSITKGSSGHVRLTSGNHVSFTAKCLMFSVRLYLVQLYLFSPLPIQLSTHPPSCSPTHQYILPLIRPISHAYIHPLIQSIYLSICRTVPSAFNLSMFPANHPFIPYFTHIFFQLSTYPLTHSSICLSTHPLNDQSTHPSHIHHPQSPPSVAAFLIVLSHKGVSTHPLGGSLRRGDGVRWLLSE